MKNYGVSEQYRPLSPWAYFGYTILYGIPVIGIIMLVIHSFNDSNINRRNFARSFWCIYIIAAIAIAIGLATGAAATLFNLF